MSSGDKDAADCTHNNLNSSEAFQHDSPEENITRANVDGVHGEIGSREAPPDTELLICVGSDFSQDQLPSSASQRNFDVASSSSTPATVEAEIPTSSHSLPAPYPLKDSLNDHSLGSKPGRSVSPRNSKGRERSGSRRQSKSRYVTLSSSWDSPSNCGTQGAEDVAASGSFHGDAFQDPKTGDQERQKKEEGAVAVLSDTRVVWGSTLLILTCYVIALMTLPALSTQYLNYKIGKDDYNFTYKAGEKDTDCSNSSSQHEDLLNKIQRDTSDVVLVASLASGVPSALTCLVVGSYSDFLGRRPLIIASVLGGLARSASLTAVIYFDLSVQLFYAGSFVDGVLGSSFTLALAITAVIADITPVPQSRALRFAVVEGTLFTVGALAQVGIGFMIKSWDYFVPSASGTCLLVFAVIVALFFLPETMMRRNMNNFRWNPTTHMRKVFGFYIIKGPGCQRFLYIIGLSVFLFLVLANQGHSNVETLFFLNAPICFNSIDIGVFQALRL
ncbi:hypothetical protein EGW08_004054, partial [Elysia chlorotica]